MTIASDYYAAVEGLFRHYNHKSTDQLLGEIMEELRQKGYDPLFCAKFLAKTLRDEADRLPTFGECPMTETRAEKAQRLVDEGRVTIDGSLTPFIAAHVEGDHGGYETTLCPAGNYFCTCDWGIAHWYGYDLCAHALAVKLTVEKEN